MHGQSALKIGLILITTGTIKDTTAQICKEGEKRRYVKDITEDSVLWAEPVNMNTSASNVGSSDMEPTSVINARQMQDSRHL